MPSVGTFSISNRVGGVGSEAPFHTGDTGTGGLFTQICGQGYRFRLVQKPHQ